MSTPTPAETLAKVRSAGINVALLIDDHDEPVLDIDADDAVLTGTTIARLRALKPMLIAALEEEHRIEANAAVATTLPPTAAAVLYEFPGAAVISIRDEDPDEPPYLCMAIGNGGLGDALHYAWLQDTDLARDVHDAYRERVEIVLADHLDDYGIPTGDGPMVLADRLGVEAARQVAEQAGVRLPRLIDWFPPEDDTAAPDAEPALAGAGADVNTQHTFTEMTNGD